MIKGESFQGDCFRGRGGLGLVGEQRKRISLAIECDKRYVVWQDPKKGAKTLYLSQSFRLDNIKTYMLTKNFVTELDLYELLNSSQVMTKPEVSKVIRSSICSDDYRNLNTKFKKGTFSELDIFLNLTRSN